jgi:hypothetical protein
MLRLPFPVMRRTLANALAMLLGVALTLAAVGVLLKAVRWIEATSNVFLRAGVIASTLLVGVVLLILSVFIAVRIAVWLAPPGPPPTAPVNLQPRDGPGPRS